MRTFFAILALVANAATITLVVAAVAGKGSTIRSAVLGAIRGYELWLAGAVALTATLGSLYLSEIADLPPCTLCWYQRIAMYPLSLLLLVAAFRKDHGIRVYAAPLAVVGGGIAAYHRLIQAFPQLDSGACSATGPPCSSAWFEVFGFITIPTMALSGFLVILALLWADRANSPHDAPSSPPAEAVTEPA